MNRRNLLKLAAGGTGAFFTNQAYAEANCFIPTKEQTEGPFYPKDWTEYEADADMTKLADSNLLANGQLTIVKGEVIDFSTCKPVAGAQVDVWQANAFGQYFHENDATVEELRDKNFQYRCRLISDDRGRFSFKTIKPSPYPASATWIRPPHIHFKVITETHQELTTQMYFSRDPLNPSDRILQNMTEGQKDGVTVEFNENASKILEGFFTLALMSN